MFRQKIVKARRPHKVQQFVPEKVLSKTTAMYKHILKVYCNASWETKNSRKKMKSSCQDELPWCSFHVHVTVPGFRAVHHSASKSLCADDVRWDMNIGYSTSPQKKWEQFFDNWRATLVKTTTKTSLKNKSFPKKLCLFPCRGQHP